MKIALTCPASLPATQFGGILFLCVDMAKKAAKEGHDATIYTTDLDFANNAKTFNKNLPKLELIDNFKINRTHVWFSVRLFYVNPKIYLEMVRGKPDIIHAIGVRSFQAYIAALVARRKKIPLVISDQGGLTTHPDLKTSNVFHKFLFRMQNPMIKFIINSARKIIVANEYEKNIFRNFCDESKIVIIRNGIDLGITDQKITDFKVKYKINTDFILFLGRFHKVKGLDILLQAINLIKDELSALQTKLVIMGVDFGFEKQLFELIEQFSLTENIVVIKNPPREDVLGAYNECEFLVLPSRWELSPLTPLEGFAFKKPVISTTAHGIPHTITNNENAILVQPENYRELADAILNLLKDKNKRISFGNSGFKLVQELCNSDLMASKTLDVYKEIKQ
jgi:glycosyltransferase involved in cell wall biosynthesis